MASDGAGCALSVDPHADGRQHGHLVLARPAGEGTAPDTLPVPVSVLRPSSLPAVSKTQSSPSSVASGSNRIVTLPDAFAGATTR